MDALALRKVDRTLRSDSFYDEVAYKTHQDLRQNVQKYKLKFIGMNWLLVNERQHQKKHTPYKKTKKKDQELSAWIPQEDLPPTDPNRSMTVPHHNHSHVVSNNVSIDLESSIHDQFFQKYNKIDEAKKGAASPNGIIDKAYDELTTNYFMDQLKAEVHESSPIKKRFTELFTLAEQADATQRKMTTKIMTDGKTQETEENARKPRNILPDFLKLQSFDGGKSTKRSGGKKTDDGITTITESSNSGNNQSSSHPQSKAQKSEAMPAVPGPRMSVLQSYQGALMNQNLKGNEDPYLKQNFNKEYTEYIRATKRLNKLREKLIQTKKKDQKESLSVQEGGLPNPPAATESMLPLKLMQDDATQENEFQATFKGRDIKMPVTSNMEKLIRGLNKGDQKINRNASEIDNRFGEQVIKDAYADYYEHILPRRKSQEHIINERDEFADTNKTFQPNSSQQHIFSDDPSGQLHKNSSSGHHHHHNSSSSHNNQHHSSSQAQSHNRSASLHATSSNVLQPQKGSSKGYSYEIEQSKQHLFARKVYGAGTDNERLNEIIRQFREQIPQVLANRLLNPTLNVYEQVKVPMDSPFVKRKNYDAWYVPVVDRQKKFNKYLDKEGIKDKHARMPCQTPNLRKPEIPHELFRTSPTKSMQHSYLQQRSRLQEMISRMDDWDIPSLKNSRLQQRKREDNATKTYHTQTDLNQSAEI